MFSSQLHLKEKRRFNFADQDGSSGLNVTEFLAFTHPSEVDHMAVRFRLFFLSPAKLSSKLMVAYFVLLPPQEFTIEDVLAEYDSDKDEYISLSEFIGDVRGEGKKKIQL